jgi:hypothetical protein
MTEYEVYELALSLREFSHSIGESVALQMQFWISVSFAFIAITFIAPQRLTIPVAAYLLAIYVTFSGFSYFDASSDMHLADKAMEQQEKILAENGKSTYFLESTARYQEFSLAYTLGTLYIPALFFGVIGYVSITTRKTHIVSKRENVD